MLNQLLTPAQYRSRFHGEPHLLLDVRRPDEFATGHIFGAKNIALETLPTQLGDVPRDRTMVLYCRSGRRSAEAATLLRERGYRDVYDLGGILGWAKAGYPVVNSEVTK